MKFLNIQLKERHKQLLGMVKDSKFILLLAMLCMMVEAGGTSAAAYLIKPALDDVFINKDRLMLKLVPLAIFVVYLLRSFAMFGQEYLMSYVGQNTIRRLRNRLYDRIQDLPLSFFHREKTGVLMSRITNDVNIIKHMVSTAVTGSLRDAFTILGLTIVIFYQIWQLALVAFLVLPAAIYPIVVFGRRVRRTSTGCQKAMADMSAFLHETFAGNKIVKAFGMEPHEKKRFFEKTRKLFRLEMKEVKYKAISSPINLFLGGIAVAAIIAYGGLQVIQGVYTAGTFMSFVAAVILLYRPIKELSKLNNALQQGLAATDRVFDILEKESDITERSNPVSLKPGSHRVSFNKVSFKYDEELVLKDIDLDVRPGEILALVGMSGGGKTSLVNLIPRFYDVAGGAVLVDGIDIRDASIKSLRDQIAVVTQEPILFDDTVKNNIAYGRHNAAEHEIIAAARAAYAYDFIQNFPQKFDTRIGELGTRLSGGEKQRICIARALLKDAPILILDEATSALDSESELWVQKALENLMKGRTTFVIAHRLSTVNHAHRIIVLVDGQIVEEGDHETLIARHGAYYRLHQMQFSNEGQHHH
ncbi:MAG: ABC transporter transmembrane domain-containing protein [Desulfobacterales bacterium]|jgi:subfamily B ATP-binding cassette protein MsbA